MKNLLSAWNSVHNKAMVVFTNEAKKFEKSGGSKKSLMTIVDDARMNDFGTILQSIDGHDFDAKNIDRKALVKSFKAGVTTFKNLASTYAKRIDEAVKCKLTVKDRNGQDQSLTLKEAVPAVHQQLKILKTEIMAEYALAENELAIQSEKADLQKIDDDSMLKQSKITGTPDEYNAKVKAIKEIQAMKRFKKTFAAGFKSAMAKAAAAVKKMKASPDARTYGDEMNAAGRDVAQQMNNIVKLQAHKDFKDSKLAKKLPAPGPLVAKITPFANGDKRTVPQDATEDLVKQTVAEFSAVVKEIHAAYADVIAGKFD